MLLKIFILLNNNNMNNKNEVYELQCSTAIYDCLVLVVTPNMYLAKKQIIQNFVNLDISKYITDFKPYKSRLMLNIPILQKTICHYLYLTLNQFYEIDSDDAYCTISTTEGTHEDVDELVFKISTILSNKLLGKNIIKYVEPIESSILYL